MVLLKKVYLNREDAKNAKKNKSESPYVEAFFAQGFFGLLVTLIRMLTNGTETREALPAALAVYEALYGAQNGLTVVRAHVEFGRVRDTYGYSA
ncbi:MAG: hypothetical protein NZM11_00100 [Anaerolineales bacterium]|nr:hypothetical protein [Anaerolineales bacterium]